MATNKYHPNVCASRESSSWPFNFPKSLRERERRRRVFMYYNTFDIQHTSVYGMSLLSFFLFLYFRHKNVQNDALLQMVTWMLNPLDIVGFFLLRDDFQIKENKCCIVPHLFSCIRVSERMEIDFSQHHQIATNNLTYTLRYFSKF